MKKEIQINRHFQGSLSGMTAKGFTLIELLVVVLVIGILAAIALPQYQKAVEKSRLTEALHNAKLIEECFAWYQMEHGLPSRGWVNLKDMNCPIEINLGEWDEDENVYISNNFRYSSMGCSSERCAADINRWPSYTYSLGVNTRQGNACFTELTSMGHYICNSLRNQGWKYVDNEL